MGTVLKHHGKAAPSIETLPSYTSQEEKITYLKAVNTDDAAVEENMWNDRLEECRGEQDEQTWLSALNTLQNDMLNDTD
eukprot:14394423-Ditylum_brightwellii.AAC.2